MKKLLIMFLSVIVMFTCVLSLSACSSSEDTSAIDPEEEYTEEEYTEEVAEEDLDDPNGVCKGIKIFNSEGYIQDTYFLEYDGDFDEKYDDEENFYKIGDEIVYTIVPREYKYGVFDDVGNTDLYGPSIDLPNGKPGFYSYGEVPRLVASNKDRITIRTSTGDAPVLGLRKLEIYGKNALPIIYEQKEVYRNAYHTSVADAISHYQMRPEDFHDFSVTDSKGKPVEDFYNVPSGKYTVSWYEGTSKEEMTIPANSTAFQYSTLNERADLSFKNNYDYTVECIIDEEYDLAKFPLTEIPPGIYTTDRGGVFEIR